MSKKESVSFGGKDSKTLEVDLEKDKSIAVPDFKKFEKDFNSIRQ